MTQQLTPNQKQWITALRSGLYTQGEGKLHSTDGFCCLGVAAKEFLTCDVKVTANVHGSFTQWKYNGEPDVAPDYVMNALGLYDSNGSTKAYRTQIESTSPTSDYIASDELGLTTMNDNGKTFDQIADIIEANPENYFLEDHKL
jgi:hypothetical protein